MSVNGRIADMLKKYSWLLNTELYYSTWKPEEVLRKLTARLRERGLEDVAEHLEKNKDMYSLAEVYIDSDSIDVILRSGRTVPHEWFYAEIPFVDGEGIFSVIKGLTGRRIRIPEDGTYYERLEAEYHPELVREMRRRKDAVEEAVICTVYDIAGEDMIVDWGRGTREGRELLSLIKRVCGTRKL